MTEFVRNLAVVIGINQYQNGIQPLNTAVQDAHKLADILQTHHHYQLIHPTAAEASAANSERSQTARKNHLAKP